MMSICYIAAQYAITKRSEKKPSCKKSVRPQKAIVKKDMKSKVVAKKRLQW